MLVGILSPRDIPQFMDSVKTSLTGYDKLWLRYYRQFENPYQTLKDEFLKLVDDEEYQYLALLPDDLVINKAGVDKLAANVASNPKKYEIMMGNCNVEIGSPYVAVTKNLPSLDRKKRVYNWYTKKLLLGKGIVPVKHSGTPLCILNRELITSGIISLKNDKEWNPDTLVGTSEDVVLSWDAYTHGIPIYVDTDVMFLHLKEPTVYTQ